MTPPSAAPPVPLLDAYAPEDGVFDEMVDGDGRLRTTWATVGGVLEELGLDELLRRRGETDRLLDQDGVGYNVIPAAPPADVGALSPSEPLRQQWGLDPIPAVLSSDEWLAIEQGVIERAELLNLVLTDLYGERDLLRRGVVPAEVVYGHAGFLRACDGIRIPGTQQLFTYAVDLARDPGGGYRVLADRTQAPSGFGYALENRVVISRVFPSLYRDAQVHRLAPFFRSLRSALQHVAPPGVDDPRIVVLTPGRWSETAFEHAYVASYLGYSLVEGADLTVRDGRVYLRSLGRLEPVHVILRRVDSWFADPLELRPDSQLGIPGLVEASRRGTVTIVNTIGSSALENPGLHAFLPAISEHFLGRALQLPTVETWWCGLDVERSHVLANLDRLVIRPISRREGPNAAFGWELTAAQRAELASRIIARPWAYVGQEPVSLASAPTLTERGVEPRRTVLRTFAVARRDSYTVMSGGLTRVAPTGETARVSNQAGATSKDTWVLASEPEKLTGFWLHAGPTVEALDPAATMPSRAAENLLWLGRYAERAEDVTRLLRVVYDRRNDFQGGATAAGHTCLEALLMALTQITTTYPGFIGDGAGDRLASPGAELLDLAVDEHRPGTLAHAVRCLLDAAYAVRDQLSGDTWLVVGSLDREILNMSMPAPDRQAVVQAALSRVMQSLLALAGLGAESMVRDPGWLFMDAGRRIERAIQLAALLQSTLTTAHDTATDSLLLESVLTTAESIITYRRRYRSHAQLETVLDLLLLDPGNPRSLVFQLDRLTAAIDAMPAPVSPHLREEQRLVLELSTLVRLADTSRLAVVDEHGRRPELDAFLARVHDLLRRASDAIDAQHFTHLAPQRAMAALPVRSAAPAGGGRP